MLDQKDVVKKKYGKDASHVGDERHFALNSQEQRSAKCGSSVISNQPIITWPSSQECFDIF